MISGNGLALSSVVDYMDFDDRMMENIWYIFNSTSTYVCFANVSLDPFAQNVYSMFLLFYTFSAIFIKQNYTCLYKYGYVAWLFYQVCP